MRGASALVTKSSSTALRFGNRTQSLIILLNEGWLHYLEGVIFRLSSQAKCQLATVLRNESDSGPIWPIFFFFCTLPYMWACTLNNEVSIRNVDKIQLRHFPSHKAPHSAVMASQSECSYRVCFVLGNIVDIIFHHCRRAGVTPLPLVQFHDNSVRGCNLKLHGY